MDHIDATPIVRNIATTVTAHNDATVEQLLPPDAATIDLSEADRIVSGGAGLDDARRFVQLAELGATLRASVGATRVITDRGWVAYFNDLHKGRNTGLVWKIFIDVVAGACLFFALTGLVLLWIQARQRTSTWPLVSLGVALLVVLMILFAH